MPETVFLPIRPPLDLAARLFLNESKQPGAVARLTLDHAHGWTCCHLSAEDARGLALALLPYGFTLDEQTALHGALAEPTEHAGEVAP